MVSFWGQKKVGPRPDWSPLGVNLKFPTSIPAPFIWESTWGHTSTLTSLEYLCPSPSPPRLAF